MLVSAGVYGGHDACAEEKDLVRSQCMLLEALDRRLSQRWAQQPVCGRSLLLAFGAAETSGAAVAAWYIASQLILDEMFRCCRQRSPLAKVPKLQGHRADRPATLLAGDEHREGLGQSHGDERVINEQLLASCDVASREGCAAFSRTPAEVERRRQTLRQTQHSQVTNQSSQVKSISVPGIPPTPFSLCKV
jgi:hypothetical protein